MTAQYAIRAARAPADLIQARELFTEYVAWIGVDLAFQGIADELATLPGDYAPPRGRLLLAGPADEAVGCIALRPLDIGDGAPGTVAEVKRLYVRPVARGAGLGEALVTTIVAEARGAGYRELKLDTLGHMSSALRLYSRLGFAECSPYYHNPLPGAVYMSRAL